MFTVEQEAGSKKPTRISILPTQKVEHSEAERKGVEVGFCGGHVPARLNHRPTVTVFCVYMMWEEYFSHHTPKCPATAQVCWWNADYRCWIRSLSDTWRRLGSLLRVCGLVQRGSRLHVSGSSSQGCGLLQPTGSSGPLLQWESHRSVCLNAALSERTLTESSATLVWEGEVVFLFGYFPGLML